MHSYPIETRSTADLQPFDLELPGLAMPPALQPDALLADQLAEPAADEATIVTPELDGSAELAAFAPLVPIQLVPERQMAERPGELAAGASDLLQDYQQDNIPDDTDATAAWQHYMSRRERHLSLLAAGWKQDDQC
ncbi:hypothetical protein [Dictyobacter kobayashii]|uniref:Uncharacterized protein n=1 Tax=Dictyobacter kobayashii TaxID=2014872 RepID=A0A402AR84_9CHLR|nr:hypothetical protein [Dictyobacter kobayashii]GCE21605.1 hypothetical protein KDK_54050 [Dictyobacter kobayashii]